MLLDDGDIGDYDVVPRMDSFIREHPDFSYHNARGTVALTGYNGVFGYRTDIDYEARANLPGRRRSSAFWQTTSTGKVWVVALTVG